MGHRKARLAIFSTALAMLASLLWADLADAKNCGHFYICSRIHCACGDTVIQNYTLNSNNPNLVNGVLDCSTDVGLTIAGSRCPDSSATFTCNLTSFTCNDGPLATRGCETDDDCRVATCTGNKCDAGEETGAACGVVFDGGGNTIRGPGTQDSSHYGIAFENILGTPSQGSTVQNLTIEDYNHGVKLHNTRHNTVDGLTLTGLGDLANANDNLSIQIQSYFGVSLHGAKFDTVENTTAEAYMYGINLLTSDRNLIDTVTTTRNGNFVDETVGGNHVGYGIRVEGASSDSDYNTFKDCTVDNNADEGIHLGTGVTGNIIDGGNYRDNVVENIYLQGADGNTIMNVLTDSDPSPCTAEHTPKLCCSGNNQGCGKVSLNMEDSSLNTVTGNMFLEDAVFVVGSSDDNTFTNNTIDGGSLRFDVMGISRPTGNLVTGGTIDAPNAPGCIVFDESYGNTIDTPNQVGCGARDFLTATEGTCRVKPSSSCNVNIDCGNCCGVCQNNPQQACCTNGQCSGSQNFCIRTNGTCDINPAVSCTSNDDCRICDPIAVYSCSGAPATCQGGPSDGESCTLDSDCNLNTYSDCGQTVDGDFSPVSPPAEQSIEVVTSASCP